MEEILQDMDKREKKSQQSSSKCEENCNKIFFYDLSNKLEEIEKLSGVDKKFKAIFNKKLLESVKGQSIFPLMRLILPLIDNEREKYGLKQSTVAKTYVDALHLDKKISADAQKLIFWKDPSKYHCSDSIASIGDFASILEDVLKSRVRSEISNKTIKDVNEILDNLAKAKGKEAKTSVIRNQILNHFSANEQKWLMRIVFQDLKIGLKHEQIFNRISSVALQRYNECTNLRTVCEEEGSGCQTTAGLQIFTQFSPMLAKGFTKSSSNQIAIVETAMRHQPFVMDIKLDGERMLIHKKGKEFLLFSRNGTDYTESYYSIGECVTKNITVHECILDGEICGWDNLQSCFLPFGSNAEVAREERMAQDGAAYGGKQPSREWAHLAKWLMFIVFDIVYLYDSPDSDARSAAEAIDSACRLCKYGRYSSLVPGRERVEGDSDEEDSQHAGGEISHLPLVVRREVLKRVVLPLPHRFELIHCRYVYDTLDEKKRRGKIEEYFNEVTLAGEEGLVVKNLSSPYVLGMRSKAMECWVKVKPEYGDQTQDLDLLILAGYYGEGRSMRGRGLSTFLLGVVDKSAGRTVPEYLPLCKVGTGYSFAQLAALRSRMEEVAVPWGAGPAHLAHWAYKATDKPNVYIPPDHSFLVELKCAEIVPSTQFSAGVTCRFPRLKCIRYDKPVEECLTLQELQVIRNAPRKTCGDNGGLSTSTAVRKKRQAESGSSIASRREQSGVGEVDSRFKISRKDVQLKGCLFEGMTFCVLDCEFVYLPQRVLSELESAAARDGSQSYSRDQLISLVREQRAGVVANPVPGALVLAAVARRRLV